MFEVLESADFVARNSRDVTIDSGSVFHFAKKITAEKKSFSVWDGAHHFSGMAEKVTAYILVLDTINFCFWPPEGGERWRVAIDGRSYSGYNGLAMALKQAMESGVPLEDAAFLEGMSEERLREVLGGCGTLQFMKERARALKELGHVLNRDYRGDSWRFVEASKGWAGSLVRVLAKKLESFRDMAVYRERAVYFYKRGQILCADLHGALDGKAWGRFHDLDGLTAFADYKLPQVLRNLGILVYSGALSRRVDALELIAPGSPEEVEIRANTIVAVEGIRETLQGLGLAVKSHEIDGLLWHMGQEDTYRERPYHRTPTIFY